MSDVVWWRMCWIGVTLLLFTIPMLPAWFELKRPRDSNPLNILSEHTGNLNFAALEIKPDLPFLSDLPSCVARFDDSENGKYLSWCISDFRAKTAEDVVVGVKELNDLVSDSNIWVKSGSRINRVIHAEKIFAERGARLGDFSTAEKELKVEPDVRFSRMASERILTVESLGIQPEMLFHAAQPIKPSLKPIRYSNHVLIPAGDSVDSDMVIQGDFRCGAGAQIKANVKVRGRVRLERGSMLYGALFVEGDVLCEEGVFIAGPLSATGLVHLRHGCQVGAQGRPSSVAGFRVRLETGVEVFGSVTSVARGRVVPRESA